MDNQKISAKKHTAPWSKYYPRAFGNLTHMGHCAPTVMKTLLDATSTKKEWLVKLSAGMPGGIGNTGHECGAVTSPLVMMGMRYGLSQANGGLPEIFERGHAFCQGFVNCQHTMQCKIIRGNDHFPRHCIPPVLRSTGLYMDANNGKGLHAIPPATRESYTRLYAHLQEHKFHCAQAVLRQLGYDCDRDRELFDAVSAFMGGTLFMGGTCSAFTAGVMAIGLKIGEIEDSPLRVIRLLAIMTVDGNAFDDRLNKFNHSMNQGYQLSKWFANEYGSTQCREITGCDFSQAPGVDHFIQDGRLSRCQEIAIGVAKRVEEMLPEQVAI